MIYREYAIFRRYKGRITEWPDEDPNYHGNLYTKGGKPIIIQLSL